MSEDATPGGATAAASAPDETMGDDASLSPTPPPAGAHVPSDDAAATTPTTPRRRTQLTRDQRIQVQTLRRVGWKYSDIAAHLHITPRQVQIASTASTPTPKKRPGRPPKLDEVHRRQLMDFVAASPDHRRLTYAQMREGLGWLDRVSDHAIRRALKTEGFVRDDVPVGGGQGRRHGALTELETVPVSATPTSASSNRQVTPDSALELTAPALAPAPAPAPAPAQPASSPSYLPKPIPTMTKRDGGPTEGERA